MRRPKSRCPIPQLPQIAPASGGKSVHVWRWRPIRRLFDGSFANNAWLQECPKPFTKQVWGNALHVAEATRSDLGLVDGDVVRLDRRTARS